VAKKLKGTCCG